MSVEADELNALHAQVCKAIADPKRMLIITVLRDTELSVGELCDAVGASQSNVSQHLAVLRDHGVVQGRRQGTTVFYSLTSDKVVRALDLMREFMAERRAVEDPATPATPAPAPGSRISSVFLG